MKSYSITKQPYTCQLFLTQMWGDFRLHVRDFRERPSDFYRFSKYFPKNSESCRKFPNMSLRPLSTSEATYLNLKKDDNLSVLLAMYSLYIRTFFFRKMVQPEICQSIKNILSYSLVIRFLLFNFIESQHWFLNIFVETELNFRYWSRVEEQFARFCESWSG